MKARNFLGFHERLATNSRGLELTVRNLFLACRSAAIVVSLSVANPQASVAAPQAVEPSDICNKARLIDPQLEVDAGFIAKSLHDGSVKVRKMFEEYQAEMKKKDDYSETHKQPFLSHLQILYSAMFCADPDEISATRDPKDNSYEWRIDYWRADTSEIYETVKGHDLTPKLIADAKIALNHNIKTEDRDQAVAHFNTRAHLEKQPMRIGYNSQRELELRAVALPNDQR